MAICKPCHPGCKTCTLGLEQDTISYDFTDSFETAANSGSTTDGQCTSCYAGWYFVASSSDTVDGIYNGDMVDGLYIDIGTCEPCHLSCSACTGPGPNECLYCYDDRTLVQVTEDSDLMQGALVNREAGDWCMCKDGTLSDNLFTCFAGPECPVSLIPLDDNWCAIHEYADPLIQNAKFYFPYDDMMWDESGLNTPPL